MGRYTTPVVAAAALAVCAVFMPAGAGWGSGIAAASSGHAPTGQKAVPNVDGESWSTAQSALKKAGFTASLSSTTGDEEALSDCEVTNVREGFGAPTNVAVSVNCDAKPVKKS